MAANILVSTKDEFESLISEEKVVVVDFWATWCGPCRMLGPIIEQLNEAYDNKIKVVKIDVDKEKELATLYDVQSVPTVIIFKNGQIHSREVGVKPIKAYRDIIDEIL